MQNKNILITGGTGSFGNVFLSKVLKLRPNKVIIFSRDEMKQWEMKNRFKNYENLRFFVGDIRDKERLSRAIDQIDTVIYSGSIVAFFDVRLRLHPISSDSQPSYEIALPYP